MKLKVSSPFLQNVTPVFFLVQLSPSTSCPDMPLAYDYVTKWISYWECSDKSFIYVLHFFFIYLVCLIVLGLVTQML
jgi:hypothetical protein